MHTFILNHFFNAALFDTRDDVYIELGQEQQPKEHRVLLVARNKPLEMVCVHACLRKGIGMCGVDGGVIDGSEKLLWMDRTEESVFPGIETQLSRQNSDPKIFPSSHLVFFLHFLDNKDRW